MDNSNGVGQWKTRFMFTSRSTPRKHLLPKEKIIKKINKNKIHIGKINENNDVQITDKNTVVSQFNNYVSEGEKTYASETK